MQTLDSHFVVDACHHDIPVIGHRRTVYGEQVAIKNTHLDHAVSPDLQEVVRRGFKKAGGQVAVVFNILFCQHRIARCHTAHDRDARARGQSDAAGGAGNDFQRALASQSLEVFFGGISRLETQFPGDIRAGRRVARLIYVLADDIQHLLLTICKLFHHGTFCLSVQVL